MTKMGSSSSPPSWRPGRHHQLDPRVAANPNSGTGYELEVIAMVVIGGTALAGGRGTIIGTVLGILMLRIMRNGIILIGVPGLAYNIFIGVTIILA
jgi:simple sugar transport system permease protein